MPNELTVYDQRDNFPSNPEPRAPCLLLIDASASTSGEANAQINAGLVDFVDELQMDDLTALRAEIALLTFGGGVRVEHPFVAAHAFRPPQVHAGGGTPMAEAILLALQTVERRLDQIEQHDLDAYKPWIFMVTDGQPTSSGRTLRQARDRIRELEKPCRIGFFAVGTDDANMELLAELSVRPPCRLRHMQYRKMFHWIAQSVTQVSQSIVGQEVDLPDPRSYGWSEP